MVDTVRSNVGSSSGSGKAGNQDILVVTNSEELRDALASVTGGEEIRLAYNPDGYNIPNGVDFAPSSTVVITSLDPSRPADIHQLLLKGAENLHFEGLSFVSTEAESDPKAFQLHFSNSKNITIEDSEFKGAANGIRGSDDPDLVDGSRLLSVRNSEGFQFIGNSVEGYNHGLVFREVKNTIVRDNDISKLQGDGIRMVDVDNMLIEENYIHDFIGSAKNVNHMDMIQLWSTDAKTASQNIQIRSNVFDSGSGYATQTIHMRNETVDLGVEGRDFFYRNIVIEDNVIRNGHLNGIRLGEVDGLQIKNNKLILNPDTPMILKMTEDGLDFREPAAPKIFVNTKSVNVEILNQTDDLRVIPEDATVNEGNQRNDLPAPVFNAKPPEPNSSAKQPQDSAEDKEPSPAPEPETPTAQQPRGINNKKARGTKDDDVLAINSEVVWVKGGRGDDVVQLAAGDSFSLTNTFFHSVEVFDMRNGGENVLELNFGDLRSNDGLIVNGDTMDTILLDTSFGKVDDEYTTERVEIDGDSYTHIHAKRGSWLDVNLYVEDGINVDFI